jgi:hypothetical protein
MAPPLRVLQAASVPEWKGPAVVEAVLAAAAAHRVELRLLLAGDPPPRPTAEVAVLRVEMGKGGLEQGGTDRGPGGSLEPPGPLA